jgi:hypothetical protein
VIWNLKRANALMAFKEDIQKRGLIDWLVAHTSFAKPLHRYEGELTLWNDRIFFKGEDKKARQRYALEIGKNDVEDIFYGFDNIFRRGEDRALGISFQPLRIKFRKNGSIVALYFIIEYQRALRTSNNKEWFTELNRWLNSA